MSSLHRVCSATLFFAWLVSPAWAQTRAVPPERGDWTHGSTLSLAGGVATESSDTGAVAGGAIGWELTPRVMVEGGALWIDHSNSSDGFNAAVKVRAGLRRVGVSPFGEVGVGLYHVSTNDASAMPEFYRRRMATGSSGGMVTQSFTDPSFHFGAGINFFVSRHLALQPAAEMLVVTSDSNTYTIGAFSCRLAYHFEDHPVTR